MSDNEFTGKFTERELKKMFDARSNLKKHIFDNAQRGNIQNIIEVIDTYSWTTQWFMNVGDRKGKILDQALQTKKPNTVLELGTFLGYSSLRIVSQLSKDALFVTIEFDSESAEIARAIHEYAGVTDRIKIVNDRTENVIPHLKDTFKIDSFDFIFIDHAKDFYLRDFKMLEDAGLIQTGTMIVADNVITPGAPDYLEYVQNNPNYTTTMHESNIEYNNDIPDAIAISIRK